MTHDDGWPALRVDDWTPTRETLHLWLQIVGKIRMLNAPLINHWWQVPFYVTSRGLSTSLVTSGQRAFDVEFDFVGHRLQVRDATAGDLSVPLQPQSVAEFFDRVTHGLAGMGVDVGISSGPNEVDPAVPFARDEVHADYDGAAVHAFWLQLLQAHRTITEFRAGFLGKVSPVHFFWGSFDLACTRFSGRSAPTWRGSVPNCASWVMQEGYSHEVSSCGFWPGGSAEGSFYAYAYPTPEGFAKYAVGPEAAFFDEGLGQFLLPWEAVRASARPDDVVAEFLRTSYAAAADLGGWARDELETDPRRLPVRR